MQRLIYCLALLVTFSMGTLDSFAMPISGSAGDPGKPDLIYDPLTGEVFLDATDIGGTLQAYNIKNSGGGILNGNYTPILSATPTTSLSTEIGEFQLSPTATPAGGLSIGEVFPAGMDQAQLSAFVTGGIASPAFGGGSWEFEPYLLGFPPSVGPSNASFASDADLDVLNLDFGALTAEENKYALPARIYNYSSTGEAIERLDLVSITGSGDTSALTTTYAPFTGLA